jgi:CheY-like chemotaxis protein
MDRWAGRLVVEDRMKVLFVENHAVFAAAVVDRFLGEHDVTVLPTVLEALDALRRETFDVVLLDYDRDDVKGDVFLRRRGARVHVPVVAVSAKPDGNEKLLAAGGGHRRSRARREGDQERGAHEPGAISSTVTRLPTYRSGKSLPQHEKARRLAKRAEDRSWVGAPMNNQQRAGEGIRTLDVNLGNSAETRFSPCLAVTNH